jgi:polysaccharide deacetylase 2 family uncharacterized protein YibQ
LFFVWTLVVAGVSSGLTYHLTRDETPVSEPLSNQPATREILPHPVLEREDSATAVEGSVSEPVGPLVRLEPDPVLPEPAFSPSAIPEPAARIAIIIDDLGNRLSVAGQILDLPAPVTLSVLPYQSHSEEIARMSFSRNREVLLHLPMEPKEYPHQNPGEGTLLTRFLPDELKEKTWRNLEAVPHVVGVNNHMGSKFTEEEGPMEIVMKQIKVKNLFFVDSRTTSRSKGPSVARSMGVKTAARDVFLDNEPTEEYVGNQMETLVRMALDRGWAIGIGHPNRATLTVLRKQIPELDKRGIRIVPVSQLVN